MTCGFQSRSAFRNARSELTARTSNPAFESSSVSTARTISLSSISSNFLRSGSACMTPLDPPASVACPVGCGDLLGALHFPHELGDELCRLGDRRLDRWAQSVADLVRGRAVPRLAGDHADVARGLTELGRELEDGGAGLR